MARPKRDLVRVHCNLPRHVHSEILKFAEKNGISFTTAVMILCVDALAEKGEVVLNEKE